MSSKNPKIWPSRCVHASSRRQCARCRRGVQLTQRLRCSGGSIRQWGHHRRVHHVRGQAAACQRPSTCLPARTTICDVSPAPKHGCGMRVCMELQAEISLRRPRLVSGDLGSAVGIVGVSGVGVWRRSRGFASHSGVWQPMCGAGVCASRN